MVRVWLVVAFFALIFWVYAIVDVIVQDPHRYRGVSKGFWIAIVVVFPVVGGVLWFTIGRGPLAAPPIVAPDHDEEFLKDLKAQKAAPDLADQFETIRLLEDELAALDEAIAAEKKLDDERSSDGTDRADGEDGSKK